MVCCGQVFSNASGRGAWYISLSLIWRAVYVPLSSLVFPFFVYFSCVDAHRKAVPVDRTERVVGPALLFMVRNSLLP